MIKRFAAITAGLVLAFSATATAGQADATTRHHRAPYSEELQELRMARHSAGHDYVCHLEWDGPAYNGYEAICALRPKAPVAGMSKIKNAVKACSVPAVSRKDIGACVTLFLRPAHWSKDRSTYTPQGGALVADCLSQYRGIELHYCLTQPA
jgi:hypothetical protein